MILLVPRGDKSVDGISMVQMKGKKWKMQKSWRWNMGQGAMNKEQ